jgi:hypothetical protein
MKKLQMKVRKKRRKRTKKKKSDVGQADYIIEPGSK